MLTGDPQLAMTIEAWLGLSHFATEKKLVRVWSLPPSIQML